MRITFVPLCHTHRARAILDADSLQAASQSTKLGGAWDMGHGAEISTVLPELGSQTNWVKVQM